MARRRSPLGEAVFDVLWHRGDDLIIPRDVIGDVLDRVPFSIIPRSQQGRAIDYVMGRVRSLLHSSKDSWGDRRWVFIPDLEGWKRFTGLSLDELVLVDQYRGTQTKHLMAAHNRLQLIRSTVESAARRGVRLSVEQAQKILAET